MGPSSPFQPMPMQAYDETALRDMPMQRDALPAPQMAPTETPDEGLAWNEKLKRLLMLGLAVGPVGKVVGSKLGRGALAATAGAAFAPDVASAAGVGETPPAPQSGAPATASGDAVLDALQSTLRQKQQMLDKEFAGTSGTGKKGQGPATKGMQQEIDGLIRKIGDRQNQIRNESLNETPAQKSMRESKEADRRDAEIKRADERGQKNRSTAMTFGAGGAAAGVGLSALAALLTRGRSSKFNKVAGDVGAASALAKDSRFSEVGLADDVAAGVDDAYSLRGQKSPFGVRPEEFAGISSREGLIDAATPPGQGGPFQFAGKKEARAVADEVLASRQPGTGGDLGKNFENPISLGKGELALPAAGLADFAGAQALAYGTDKEADKQAYENMSYAGLGLAAGGKFGRAISKPFTPLAAKVDASAAAKVDSARNKLMRETIQARKPAPAGGGSGGPGGGQPLPNGRGSGATPQALQQAKAATRMARSNLIGNPAHKGMSAAIAAVKGRGARPTADTVMRELKKNYPAGRVDGVKINRQEIGRWLSTHGHI